MPEFPIKKLIYEILKIRLEIENITYTNEIFKRLENYSIIKSPHSFSIENVIDFIDDFVSEIVLENMKNTRPKTYYEELHKSIGNFYKPKIRKLSIINSGEHEGKNEYEIYKLKIINELTAYDKEKQKKLIEILKESK